MFIFHLVHALPTNKVCENLMDVLRSFERLSLTNNITDLLTTLPSPLPKSTTFPCLPLSWWSIFSICTGVAGMYGRQYRLRAGRTKGIEATNRPIPAPLTNHAAHTPLLCHFLDFTSSKSAFPSSIEWIWRQNR